MARGYTVNGPSATGTANKTAVTIIAATTVRPRIYEYIVGLTTAPNSTDQQLEFGAGSTTTAGTAGSNPTPKPNDAGDVASTATAGITHSAEPTYAATYFDDNAENQRALFRFVAVPGYEYVISATASNCFGLKNIAITNTSIIVGTVKFTE
jgi:hypothetical protein